MALLDEHKQYFLQLLSEQFPELKVSSILNDYDPSAEVAAMVILAEEKLVFLPDWPPVYKNLLRFVESGLVLLPAAFVFAAIHRFQGRRQYSFIGSCQDKHKKEVEELYYG